MTDRESSTTDSRIRVADAFPDLIRHLPPDQARIAGHHALATIKALPPGPWSPVRSLQSRPGDLGLLIVDGLLTRDVVLGQTVATELVGRGDLLRPADHDGMAAPVPFDVEWHVLEPTRIAVLDREFAAVIGHWPEAIELIVSSAVRRAHSLALHLAVSHLRRVDKRLLILLWHMADRWGTVGPNGVSVPMHLTHQTLGRLVGAHRPSVTTALTLLVKEGRVSRANDGTWTLHGQPPSTLAGIDRDIG